MAGIAKFSILMNSRYALLSTKIVTEEAGIDYRRGGGGGGGERSRGSRQNYNSSSYSFLGRAGPLSYILREGIRLNFISSISIGIISRVGSLPIITGRTMAARFLFAVCFYWRRSLPAGARNVKLKLPVLFPPVSVCVDKDSAFPSSRWYTYFESESD